MFQAPCYLQQCQRSFKTGRVSFSQFRAVKKQLLSQKVLVHADNMYFINPSLKKKNFQEMEKVISNLSLLSIK